MKTLQKAFFISAVVLQICIVLAGCVQPDPGAEEPAKTPEELAGAFISAHVDILSKTTGTVGIEDEQKLIAALNDFNSLDESVQALLGPQKAKLLELQTEIERLKENAALASVANKFKQDYAAVLQLTVSNVIIADETAIDTALAAYQLLGSEVKALLAEEYAKLTALKNKIAELKAGDGSEAAANAFRNTHALILSRTLDTVMQGDYDVCLNALLASDELAPKVQALLVTEKALLLELWPQIAELVKRYAAWTGGMTTVYAPDDTQDLWAPPGVGYPRIIELEHNGRHNGILLATMEEWNKTWATQGYPIFKSLDGGKTWEYVTEVMKDNELPPIWQPFLFELPRQLGNMPAGTLLLAACSINRDTHISAIRMYRSYDTGKTWEIYSTVVTGGGAGDNGVLETGVWEPFLMMLDDNRLVCYYSDCTDAANHSQQISYRVSSDGVNWGSTVKVCSFSTKAERPGMAVIARIGNGRYMMVYEVVSSSSNGIYFRYSDDGLNWGTVTDRGTRIRAGSSGPYLQSGPYIAYIPGAGANGRIIVRATYQSGTAAPAGVGAYLFYNDNSTHTNNWGRLANPTPYQENTWGVGKRHGYSAGMFMSADGKRLHLVCSTNSNNGNTKEYSRIVYSRLEGPNWGEIIN